MCRPLGVTAELLYGNHGKARLVTPSFGFVVVLTRSDRILSVLTKNMQQRLSSQADSRPAAQAIPHLLRNSNGQFSVFGCTIWPFEAQWLLYVPPGLTFNNCTLCPHCIYVFCIYLRTNSDLCHLQHKLIGFYNTDAVCLLRGTDWIFIYNSGQFQWFVKVKCSEYQVPLVLLFLSLRVRNLSP